MLFNPPLHSFASAPVSGSSSPPEKLFGHGYIPFIKCAPPLQRLEQVFIVIALIVPSARWVELRPRSHHLVCAAHASPAVAGARAWAMSLWVRLALTAPTVLVPVEPMGAPSVCGG